MDKIYIRDLEFIGYHGVFEEEKKLGQKFYLSLELSTDLREANDDITKTTHYGEVAETVKKVFFQKKYDLIETLAEDIAREVLLSFPLIKEVKLEIKKPWAPVGLPLKDVAVEITRKWNEVYLSLGSNMGNKKENLEKAIKEVSKIKDTFIIKESKIIETEPFGYKEQDDFLNSCIGIKTLLTAREVLTELLAIEIGMGRERNLIIDERLTDFTPVTHIKGEVNKEYIRKMTPREWARLQGFPNDFKLVVADTHLYKQFGNSVTVPVIRAIAERIKKHLEKGKTEAKQREETYEKVAAVWR